MKQRTDRTIYVFLRSKGTGDIEVHKVTELLSKGTRDIQVHQVGIIVSQ